ncbi:SHOCT domain-containing protein [Microbacterium dauci]|uniref:SHOCT domain-containing protein n=1 Tax=Microbacterium dauci TaxID=3048008 RepID=A0ABT6ZBE7_9MICO|nr:SHOCT domain-containing protein [Microbacterium sp. LX3-4]MDJ1113482.1 SHOCT domain-containing protein [Microbacterium sp. LX3-4]
MRQLWGEFIPVDGFYGEGEFVPVNPEFDTGFEAAAAGFNAMFGLVLVLVVAGIIVSIVVGFRKYRILKNAGIDPLTVDAAIAAKVLRSDALAERQQPTLEPSLEQRLLELDDLHARGVISDEEHREARAAALRG